MARKLAGLSDGQTTQFEGYDDVTMRLLAVWLRFRRGAKWGAVNI
jgi:hypothetical protein